jgi:tetratricopeptide (TPR) repeat protein
MATYDAFISYSHAKDKLIAAALQPVIQRLGKPWYRRRALRVFRDDTSLSATPTLWPSIERALGQSRYFILLASPDAAASKWVNKEVAHWLDHHSIETLLIGVTDGDLAWDEATGDFAARENTPLPPVLAARFPSEPKWVDLRAYRDGANTRNAKFTELAADFAATIHGTPKEDLLSQEVRQQRRALTLAWSAAASLLILGGVAAWQWKSAVAAERAAIEQRLIAQDQRDHANYNFAIARQAADSVVTELAQNLRNVQGMRVESVRRILDAARTLMDQIARAAPDDPQLQRSRAAMLSEFTETFERIGDLASAQTTAQEGLAITRKLAAADPDNTEFQRDTFVLLTRLGNLQLAAGARTQALASYENGLAIARALTASDANNGLWQRDVALVLERIGDVRLAAGDRAGALAAHEESLAIRRMLAAARPDIAELKSDLAASLDRISRQQAIAGNMAEALKINEEALAIRRSFADADLNNAERQRQVAMTLYNVGMAHSKLGDHAHALKAYEESLDILRKLAALDPSHAGWQSDLGEALEKVADARIVSDDAAGGLQLYEEALAIRRKLAAADPSNMEWQRDLSATLMKIGAVRLDADDPKAALVAYEEALAIRRKLAAADPENTQAQRDLGAILHKFGDAQSDAGDNATALAAYEESLAIRRRLVASDPAQPGWQADLAVALYNMSTVTEPPQARAALREALAIMDTLTREGKILAYQRNLQQRFLEALAKLPPETAEVR